MLYKLILRLLVIRRFSEFQIVLMAISALNGTKPKISLSRMRARRAHEETYVVLAAFQTDQDQSPATGGFIQQPQHLILLARDRPVQRHLALRFYSGTKFSHGVGVPRR